MTLIREKRHRRKVAAAVIVFLLAGLGIARLTLAQSQPPVDILEELKLFSKAVGVIQYAYVEDVRARPLLYEAVRGMLSSLDRYSEFFEPKKFKLLETSIKGEYVGVGIALDLKDNFPIVGSVLPNTPAERAQLMALDRILKVNGVGTEGKKLEDVASMIKGEAGTEVILMLYRPSTDRTWDEKLVRGQVQLEAVKDVRIVGKAIGYLRIEDFQDHTVEQVDKALKLLHEKGMKALVIDLRNNIGGVMPKAVELAERFLPEGVKIVSIESKVPEQKKEYVSSGKSMEPEYPLIVLVNQFSASASEIFTAAVQDHGRARIVGVKTFGKASMQSVIPLDDVTAMKLTTARYVSPKGRIIDKVGIQPDVEVQNGPPGSPNSDQQIVKALELLREYF